MAEVKEPAKTAVALREGTYVFQLVERIKPRFKDEPPFRKKLVLSSSVLSRDENGASRIARFIPGHPSVWQDQQDKLDRKWATVNAWAPEFVNGVLALDYPRDKEKIEYLMLRDDYAGKQNRISSRTPVYELVNKEMESASELEFEEALHKAQGIALSAKFDDFKEHAAYLGVDVNRDEKLVRADYVRAAKSDPALFIKTSESKAAKVAGLVKRAVADAYVDFGHVANQVHYTQTKALITVLDPKKKATQSLVDFALSKDGAEFLKKLQEHYNK